jgi:bifunctional non-homologous end joining protein LigD
VGNLDEYQRKRAFDATSEPRGTVQDEEGAELRFVVQEHHARRLHWDFRLERNGVLVSWALPKGVPDDPSRNHLAVHVEDHPMEYIDFAGEIPRGQYGAGSVSIWDHGTYETHKWNVEGKGQKPEVMITLHGERVQGRYVLFQTRGKDWMIHRMDPAATPDQDPMPARIRPMMAKLTTRLPPDDGMWAYEFKWDGIRAIAHCRPGEVVLWSRTGEEITARYAELRRLGEATGSHRAILDGEIVALDAAGVPRFEQIQQRMGLTKDSEIRRAMRITPVIYMAFDLLYLDGRLLTKVPYLERRKLLAGLGLKGTHWQTPEYHVGDGAAIQAAAEANQLEGVIAKRIDSQYEEGARTDVWRKVKRHHRQEFVVGGWQEGEGKRQDLAGALLAGYWKDGQLVYAGKVGTGFTDAMLVDLRNRMRPIEREESPFGVGTPPSQQVHFVEPSLVAEVEFTEWTTSGQLRAPAFKGLRRDADPGAVVREDV